MLVQDSLRMTRRRFKMTGKAVALKLGKSPAAYRRYERGEVIPNLELINNLSNIYGCSIDALIKSGGLENGNDPSTHVIEVDGGVSDQMQLVINISLRQNNVVPEIDHVEEKNREDEDDGGERKPANVLRSAPFVEHSIMRL